MKSNNDPNRLITLAIHTYEQAVLLKERLEKAGVTAVLHNVNLSEPVASSGVRVRIQEKDLPLALKVVEDPEQPKKKGKLAPRPKVLIAVDFSSYSLKSCRIGFDYAKRCDCSVVLLHAYMSAERRFLLPMGSDKYDSDDNDEVAKAKALLGMKDFRDRIEREMVKGNIANVSFETAIREGVPEQCILNCASEVKAQLIVMGTAGTSQRQRAALGSVTAEVLDSGKFPMIAIPKNVAIDNLTDVHHVAFFTNLIPQDILSFDMFSRLISNDDLEVSIIPVVEKRNQKYVKKAKEQLVEYSKNHYPNIKFNIVNLKLDDELEAFQKFADEQHIDLIAIPNKKRNIFARLYNPSIAHRVLFQTDTPMLVVPI